MEKEISVEQPEEEQAIVDEGKVSAVSDSDSTKNKTEENKFGQFKSAEVLYEAYNNLHAEFTRKCQKLSEFEKEKAQENKLSDTQVEDGLSKFLDKNIEAKDYSEELKEKVKSENNDPFESAWAKLLVEKISSSNSQKANDPFIKKHVFYDEEFRNKVIESYMQDLNSKKPPILLKTERGERATKLEPVAPQTLKEAKKLVEDLFS